MLENTCRICLQNGVLLMNIFKERQSSAISLKIMSLAKVHIHPEDGLPCTICKKCVKQIDNCTNFIKLCEDSDAKLRAAISNKSGKKIETAIKNKIPPKEFINDDLNILNSDYNEFTINTKADKKEKVVMPTIKAEDIKEETTVKTCKGTENNVMQQKKCRKAKKQQCNICGKILSSGFRLKIHLRIHTGERPYSCSQCKKSFAEKSDLKIHLRMHNGEKPFICSECDKVFRHAASLRSHKRIHSGEAPYHCSLCTKSFHTFGNLQYHLRLHSGEKNYECDSCGKTFINRSHLQQHLARHSGEKPHMCFICGLRLSTAAHLRRHVQNLHRKEKKSCNKSVNIEK